MALIHQATAQNAATDGVVDRIEDGASAGTFRIFTAAFGTQLVQINLDDPSFDSASSGLSTLANVAKLSGTATSSGLAAAWALMDSFDNHIIEGTITESGGGGDLEFQGSSSAYVNSGQTVSLNIGAITYRAMAVGS